MPRTQPRWAISFESSDRLRDQERAAEQGGDPCSRDAYCSGRRIVVENGERKVIPARTYGPFCPSCQGLIATCLSELPPAHARLEAEIPEPHRRGVNGHSPFGPRLPFDASYDALQRAITEVLASWCERVRDVARLAVLDTQLSRRRSQARAVTEYAVVLGAHLTALLALQPGPMFRSVPVRSHVDPDMVTMLMLGGQDAGEEILALHRRALLILGEIVRKRETLDGVPCKRCESMSLERAEPPSDPAREAFWSECAECHHLMTRKQYEDWAKWYGTWADRAGLECRRCQTGRHGECEYGNCACGAGQHGDVLDVA